MVGERGTRPAAVSSGRSATGEAGPRTSERTSPATVQPKCESTIWARAS